MTYQLCFGFVFIVSLSVLYNDVVCVYIQEGCVISRHVRVHVCVYVCM